MEPIYHITKREAWELAQQTGHYHHDSLESEGFIHCSNANQVIRVANRFYKGQSGLVLLRIDPARVQPEIRHEPADSGEHFPHIYGPLNIDAIESISDFPPNPDGSFSLQ